MYMWRPEDRDCAFLPLSLCLVAMRRDLSLSQKLAFRLDWLASDPSGSGYLRLIMLKLQKCPAMSSYLQEGFLRT